MVATRILMLRTAEMKPKADAQIPRTRARSKSERNSWLRHQMRLVYSRAVVLFTICCHPGKGSVYSKLEIQLGTFTVGWLWA
jgi:hypothetical protein